MADTYTDGYIRGFEVMGRDLSKKKTVSVRYPIGFERIVLLLMESGFTVPMQRPKVAYLIEKGYPADKLVDVIAKAQEERQAGKQVLVVRMNKNKKFQKEKLAAEGYKDIVEFFNN